MRYVTFLLLFLLVGLAILVWISYENHRKVKLELLPIDVRVIENSAFKGRAYRIPVHDEILLVFEYPNSERVEALHLATNNSYIAFAVPKCVELREGNVYVNKVVLEGAPFTNTLEAEIVASPEKTEILIVGMKGKVFTDHNTKEIDDSHERLLVYRKKIVIEKLPVPAANNNLVETQE